MSNITDIAKFAAADFRYGITVFSVFLLGMLLLFFKDLSPFLRDIAVPALLVFTLGSALIAHVQLLLTSSENTKNIADGNNARGIKESHLRTIIIAHSIWVLCFALFLGWKASA